MGKLLETTSCILTAKILLLGFRFTHLDREAETRRGFKEFQDMNMNKPAGRLSGLSSRTEVIFLRLEVPSPDRRRQTQKQTQTKSKLGE